MPKPKDAESFDVAGTKYRQHEDPHATLIQAARDYRTPDPSRDFQVKVMGDRILVNYHCYGQGLGEAMRLQMYLHEMSTATDEYVRLLKKRFKDLGGGTLAMKELKDERGFDRQKVSQNDRWLVVYRRTYRLDELAHSPKE